eukprot:CAMPEP_0181332988 /NCGR_PEP_ID=MMETSP1101-20121128/25411_1 /TAXON_ID=46948 /ORGANISM="Rhodomonas abbreviata, Strain Caron Lab Isolate" /LENGTH=372 /DNA_ID=CAMNT_0023442717 /DNA_START=9 /DNA_END=1127 /DNA_ORIENTATION=-
MAQSPLDRRALPLLLLLLAGASAFHLNSVFTPSCTAFQRLSSACRRAPRLSQLSMVDESEVQKLVEKIEGGKKAPKASTRVFKALKKNSGALMVATEFSRGDEEAVEGEYGVDFRTFSLTLRRNKAAVLLVDCSLPPGLSDLENFAKEQASAKGNFPGPLPIVRSGTVTDVTQVAEAKAAGADGITVDMSHEAASSLIAAALSLSLEPLAMVASEEEVAAAVEGGSKLLCVRADTPTEEAVKLKESMPKDCAALAAIDARADGGPDGLAAMAEEDEGEEKEGEDNTPKLEVIARGQALRESKFNALVLSSACNDASARAEVGFHHFLLETLQSKKSVNFAKLAKIKAPLGTGRPPAQLEGFNTILEGSVPQR